RLFDGGRILLVFKGFAASNEGMAGQLLEVQRTAGRHWRAVRRGLDGLVPAFSNQKDAELFRDAALLGAITFAGAIGAYLATVNWAWPFPRDSSTLIVGRDFLNLWMYGRVA